MCFELPELLSADVTPLPLNMRRRRVAPDLESRLVEDVGAGQLHVAIEVVELTDLDAAIVRLAGGGTVGRVVLTW